MRDNAIHGFVLFDRLETGIDGDAQSWAARSWIGTDRDRVWLRSEGERTGTGTHSADLEVLYGHSVARWWELLVGVRHDFTPAGAQDFLAVGVTGLAPYKFEVSATAYLGASGQTAARLEVEYETLLTENRIWKQRMVGIGVVLLFAILVFILQNGQRVRVRFLMVNGTLWMRVVGATALVVSAVSATSTLRAT